MVRIFRLLAAPLAIAATLLAPAGAHALTPCPSVACVAIDGRALDVHGNAVPGYHVIAQRADGYNETTDTANDGSFHFQLPATTSNNCYQVVGQADAFFANATTGRKVCSSQPMTLRPLYRINGFTGYQKVYLGDSSQTISIPVDVSALSRSYPAAFDGDALPYQIEFQGVDQKPGASAEGTHVDGDAESPAKPSEEVADAGNFPDPVVRKIADGVWQYTWRWTLKLADHEPGYYDMDWGVRTGATSVFTPMMDCRMVWFGYGTKLLTPSKATPGTVVTIQGQRLGDTPGAAILKGSGQVLTIDGAYILSWTDTQVKLLLPANAKSGWLSLVPPNGVRTNGQALTVGA